MQPLSTVYAYIDKHPVIKAITRWQPRRVSCRTKPDTTKEKGKEYVLKYRRGTAASAAANISELLTFLLMRELKLRTLQAVFVEVSPKLALSYNRQANLSYTIDAGLHFGTVYEGDTDPGPPTEWEQMADPQQLIEMWVADCWLMNIDRAVEGNIRLAVNEQGMFDLIAADNSDCFLGAARLADGSCFQECNKQGAVSYDELHNFVQRAICEAGCQRLNGMIKRIQQVAVLLPQAVELVPTVWWLQAGVNPDSVVRCLKERADGLRTLINVSHWEEIHRGYQSIVRQGINLNL